MSCTPSWLSAVFKTVVSIRLQLYPGWQWCFRLTFQWDSSYIRINGGVQNGRLCEIPVISASMTCLRRFNKTPVISELTTVFSMDVSMRFQLHPGEDLENKNPLFFFKNIFWKTLFDSFVIYSEISTFLRVSYMNELNYDLVIDRDFVSSVASRFVLAAPLDLAGKSDWIWGRKGNSSYIRGE